MAKCKRLLVGSSFLGKRESMQKLPRQRINRTYIVLEELPPLRICKSTIKKTRLELRTAHSLNTQPSNIRALLRVFHSFRSDSSLAGLVDLLMFFPIFRHFLCTAVPVLIPVCIRFIQAFSPNRMYFMSHCFALAMQVFPLKTKHFSSTWLKVNFQLNLISTSYWEFFSFPLFKRPSKNNRK